MTCQHERIMTDNVVTSCADCDDDWTAVTLAGWPEGVTLLRFGAWGDRCWECGGRWSRACGGVYCDHCDGIREPALMSRKAAAVFWVLFVSFVLVALSAAVWGPW